MNPITVWWSNMRSRSNSFWCFTSSLRAWFEVFIRLNPLTVKGGQIKSGVRFNWCSTKVSRVDSFQSSSDRRCQRRVCALFVFCMVDSRTFLRQISLPTSHSSCQTNNLVLRIPKKIGTEFCCWCQILTIRFIIRQRLVWFRFQLFTWVFAWLSSVVSLIQVCACSPHFVQTFSNQLRRLAGVAQDPDFFSNSFWFITFHTDALEGNAYILLSCFTSLPFISRTSPKNWRVPPCVRPQRSDEENGGPSLQLEGYFLQPSLLYGFLPPRASRSWRAMKDVWPEERVPAAAA